MGEGPDLFVHDQVSSMNMARVSPPVAEAEATIREWSLVRTVLDAICSATADHCCESDG